MALVLILALVVLLYWRTLTYNYVIDDNVKRDGYMYEVPLEGPKPDHWVSKPSKQYRLFMIGMHCVNTAVIYLLWGWAPALIFAVHPVGVWGTAWVTGNYYATTAYFTLIAYYIVTTFPNIYGASVAMALFVAALNSTVCCISFPFIFLFTGTPWGLSLFIPLGMYLRGHRFRTGIKTRLDFNADKPVKAPFFEIRRLVVMTKVVARYIHISFIPERQGFFRKFGKGLHETQEKYDYAHSMNPEFWASLALCVSTFAVGMVIHPTGTLWFFAVIMLHSQWNLTGQFFAERYAYLPLVGLCVVFGTALAPYPIAVACVATYLAYKTHKFIPVWRNQACLWNNDVKMFPENPSVYNNLAQWDMNQRPKDGKIPLWKVNEIAMNLQKATMMDPNAWEISMNMACFMVFTGNTQGGLDLTRKAIAQLTPIAGGSGQFPLGKLKEQEAKLVKGLEEAKKKQAEANLSPAKSKEEDNGKSKDEGKTETRVPEPIGASGA